MKNKNCFWIYILECSNGNFYTGYTNDIKRRYLQHLGSSGKSKYTRSFKPVRIAQLWKLQDIKGNAMKVESFIKGNNRKFKDDLVKNPHKLKKALVNKFGIDFKLVKAKIPSVIA